MTLRFYVRRRERVPSKDDPQFPLKGLPPKPRPPTLAPAWVALATAWLGLLTLVGFLLVPFLPGSRNPVEELEHHRFSPSDRFLPYPIYASVVVLFMGIVVLWQMRKEPRPLPSPLLAQRIQAWTGMILALVGIAFIYVYVALRGPR